MRGCLVWKEASPRTNAVRRRKALKNVQPQPPPVAEGQAPLLQSPPTRLGQTAQEASADRHRCLPAVRWQTGEACGSLEYWSWKRTENPLHREPDGEQVIVAPVWAIEFQAYGQSATGQACR
jgi:hypothetical protein